MYVWEYVFAKFVILAVLLLYLGLILEGTLDFVLNAAYLWMMHFLGIFLLCQSVQ